MLVDEAEHLPRLLQLERRPAKAGVGNPAGIVAFGEDAPLDRLACAARLGLLDGLQLVQPPDEQQVGDLLHHAQGVGHAPGSEIVPDAVDPVAYVADVKSHPPRTTQVGTRP